MIQQSIEFHGQCNHYSYWSVPSRFSDHAFPTARNNTLKQQSAADRFCIFVVSFDMIRERMCCPSMDWVLFNAYTEISFIVKAWVQCYLDNKWYFLHTWNNRFIVCACIASAVSVVTVPLDIENALCNNGVRYGKILTVGSDPDSVHFLWE